VILATWQVGQLFWSMLWFALLFMLIWAVISVFADIFRSRDLSGWSKALWTLFIVFLPWLGVFLYLVVRGNSIAERRYDPAYGAEVLRSDMVAERRQDAAYGAEVMRGYPPP
jgi:hypothetical protein